MAILLLGACGHASGVRSLPALPPGATVFPTEEYYAVTGGSVEEIRRSLRAAAAEAIGRNAVGYHRWNVRWSYQYRETPLGCEVTEIDIDLESTITLPRWRDRGSSDSSLVAFWDSYLVALRSHEYCHRVLAYQQANELYRMLRRFRAPSCGLLRPDADAAGRQILDRYRQINQEYDRSSTGYLTWPPMTNGQEAPPCPTGR